MVNIFSQLKGEWQNSVIVTERIQFVKLTCWIEVWKNCTGCQIIPMFTFGFLSHGIFNGFSALVYNHLAYCRLNWLCSGQNAQVLWRLIPPGELSSSNEEQCCVCVVLLSISGTLHSLSMLRSGADNHSIEIWWFDHHSAPRAPSNPIRDIRIDTSERWPSAYHRSINSDSQNRPS